MNRSLLVVVSVFLLFLPCSFAQNTGQDFSYNISPPPTWTDTSLDLHTGDVLQISATGTSCNPQGVSGSAAADSPLPSAPAGSLIARLHSQGALPILIGASHELRIEEPGHLWLGVNASGTPPCQGSFSVKVHLTSGQVSSAAPPASASSTSDSAAAPKPYSADDLKQKLAAAAQTWMAGQFGNSVPATSSAVGGTSGTASAAPVLDVSKTLLDAGLRKDIDGLPRRVNDEHDNLGDMVNFVIIGSKEQMQAALDAANWHIADTDTKEAALKAVLQTYEKKDYLQMPMSQLMLFGRYQDFGYEMAEPIAMVASRHHFRIWKAPFTWNGQTVWVGAGTHDIGFEKDQRNGNVTHKIDPSVDGERENIGSSLQKAGKVKSMTYYLPPNPVQDARNATGGGYHSDGRILVVFLH
jgi:LssY C-terminus